MGGADASVAAAAAAASVPIPMPPHGCCCRHCAAAAVVVVFAVPLGWALSEWEIARVSQSSLSHLDTMSRCLAFQTQRMMAQRCITASGSIEIKGPSHRVGRDWTAFMATPRGWPAAGARKHATAAGEWGRSIITFRGVWWRLASSAILAFGEGTACVCMCASCSPCSPAFDLTNHRT